MTIRMSFVILLLFLLFSCAHAQLPLIKEGKIFFPNGRVLQYTPHKILHSNPEEAHEKGEPVSISDKPILIREWARLVLVTTLEQYEEAAIEITVYNYQGDILNSKLVFIGEPIFLKEAERIFLAQKSVHYKVSESFILDKNGKIIRRVSQPENVFDFGYSIDQKIIWFLSNYIEAGKPFTGINVINTDGDVIKDIKTYKRGKVSIQYEGNTYEIAVPEPEIP